VLPHAWTSPGVSTLDLVGDRLTLLVAGDAAPWRSAADRAVFYRYAYPISSDVFVLWDTEPTGWAPQNHSCDPSTEFVGLNLVARRDIRCGEELTVDHATFYDSHMKPFDCDCGSPDCRKRVEGGKGLVGA